ncbi:MAG: hypothetical protein ACYTBS_05165 [Planctomycetota bacterium]
MPEHFREVGRDVVPAQRSERSSWNPDNWGGMDTALRDQRRMG